MIFVGQSLIHSHGRYKSEDGKERVSGSGLKHCRTNMARIVGQKAKNLDIKPNMLVLPILELKETLSYERGPYHVLVLCENAGIYVDSSLLGEYELCSCNEIETAVKTLACFVKGVAAASVVGLSDVEVISKIQPQHEQDQIRSVKRKNFFRGCVPGKVPLAAKCDASRRDMTQCLCELRLILVVKFLVRSHAERN